MGWLFAPRQRAASKLSASLSPRVVGIGYLVSCIIHYVQLWLEARILVMTPGQKLRLFADVQYINNMPSPVSLVSTHPHTTLLHSGTPTLHCGENIRSVEKHLKCGSTARPSELT